MLVPMGGLSMGSYLAWRWKGHLTRALPWFSAVPVISRMLLGCLAFSQICGLYAPGHREPASHRSVMNKFVDLTNHRGTCSRLQSLQYK